MFCYLSESTHVYSSSGFVVGGVMVGGAIGGEMFCSGCVPSNESDT